MINWICLDCVGMVLGRRPFRQHIRKPKSNDLGFFLFKIQSCSHYQCLFHNNSPLKLFFTKIVTLIYHYIL